MSRSIYRKRKIIFIIKNFLDSKELPPYLSDMAQEYSRDYLTELLRVAKENGYRKQDVAAELRVPPSRISDWIKGRTPMRVFWEQFPGLVEKFQSQPRINPVAKPEQST